PTYIYTLSLHDALPISDSSNTRAVLDPIGTCQGLNSPHSPRIVTRVRKGKRKIWVSENMLTQLPTPLDCISSSPRWPPAQAPARSEEHTSELQSLAYLV